MLDKIRTPLLSLAIIIVLVFSAESPKNAYADNRKPPKATANQVKEEKKHKDGNEADSKEKAQDSQPAAEVTAPPEEAATAESVPEAQPAAEAAPAEGEAAVPDLSALPENTEVT